jgi:hypothetical protein
MGAAVLQQDLNSLYETMLGLALKVLLNLNRQKTILSSV